MDLFDEMMEEHCEFEKELEETKEDLLLAYKVINEMAEYISNLDIDEDICMKNTTSPELCNEEHSNCKDCIKEYFYKKAQK